MSINISGRGRRRDDDLPYCHLDKRMPSLRKCRENLIGESVEEVVNESVAEEICTDPDGSVREGSWEGGGEAESRCRSERRVDRANGS